MSVFVTAGHYVVSSFFFSCSPETATVGDDADVYSITRVSMANDGDVYIVHFFSPSDAHELQNNLTWRQHAARCGPSVVCEAHERPRFPMATEHVIYPQLMAVAWSRTS